MGNPIHCQRTGACIPLLLIWDEMLPIENVPKLHLSRFYWRGHIKEQIRDYGFKSITIQPRIELSYGSHFTITLKHFISSAKQFSYIPTCIFMRKEILHRYSLIFCKSNKRKGFHALERVMIGKTKPCATFLLTITIINFKDLVVCLIPAVHENLAIF